MLTMVKNDSETCLTMGSGELRSSERRSRQLLSVNSRFHEALTASDDRRNLDRRVVHLEHGCSYIDDPTRLSGDLEGETIDTGARPGRSGMNLSSCDRRNLLDPSH